jgi:SAM-dependent methyltransferase
VKVSHDEPRPLHRDRNLAMSFGADTERYDRTRARCPQGLLERIIAASPGPAVLDVGSGTGIVARQFRDAGCEVHAVEPDRRMAAYARQSGLGVDVATFEEWDSAGRVFDVVAAGAAWHWVDPLVGAVAASHVLRPGGLLAPFWHTYELPLEISEVYRDALREMAPASTFGRWLGRQRTDAYGGLFDSVTDGIRRSGRFRAPERWQADWDQAYTRDEWLDRMPTQGQLNDLSSSEQEEVLRRVGASIDASGGRFTLRYTTVAIVARRAAD